MIESVRLLKTLKAGKNIWVEGTVFPNKRSPQIPKAVLGEAIAKRDTVEILTEKPEDDGPIVFKPKFKDKTLIHTQTTANVESSFGDVLQPNEEQSPRPRTVQKLVPKDLDIASVKTKRSKPKVKPKKSSLVRRKK